MSKRTEQNRKAAASGSANALDRAIGHLNAALTELDEAHCHATSRAACVGAYKELTLLTVLRLELSRSRGDAGTSLVDQIRELRDRRAALAGFKFDE